MGFLSFHAGSDRLLQIHSESFTYCLSLYPSCFVWYKLDLLQITARPTGSSNTLTDADFMILRDLTLAYHSAVWK